jgi:hypothetical protein
MDPIAALVLSGAIEEERRRGMRLRRRWLDAQPDRHDDLTADDLLGRHRPVRAPKLSMQSSPTK